MRQNKRFLLAGNITNPCADENFENKIIAVVL